MKEASQSEIPVVDVSAYFQAPFANDDGFPSEEQRAVSKRLDSVCRELSYFFVDGLPMSSETLAKMFQHASDMFTIATAEEKSRKLAPISRPSHVGYTGYGVETLNRETGSDIKEVRLTFMDC